MKKIFIMLAGVLIAQTVNASMTTGVMSSSERYAWSEKLGRLDMAAVVVEDTGLSGYAMAGSERIDFKTADFQVKNDGNGRLSGSARSQTYGVFNFSGVQITVDGTFQGVADGGSIGGKIIFDCPRNTACASGAEGKARTDWRPASYRIKNPEVTTPVVTTPTVTTPVATPQAQTPSDYKSCDTINDYVNYVKCIAAVDTKNNRPTVPAITESFNQSSSTNSNNSEQVVTNSTEVDKDAELWAQGEFAKLENRLATDSTGDKVMVNILAYGLSKTQKRDLSLEAVGLSKFIKEYKRTPKDSRDWKIVNALAYGKPEVGTTTSDTVTNGTPADCQMAKAFTSSLELGAKTDDVKLLQYKLKCLGYLPADFVVAANFDEATEKAVKAFQIKNKLICSDGTSCGYVGAGTRKALSQAVIPTTTTALSQKALTMSMTIGSAGEEVKRLQQWLATDKELYPEGKVSGTFDSATEKAISRFQEKNKLACNDGTYCGYVGPGTRKALNQTFAK